MQLLDRWIAIYFYLLLAKNTAETSPLLSKFGIFLDSLNLGLTLIVLHKWLKNHLLRPKLQNSLQWSLA